MKWELKYLPEADSELKNLDNSVLSKVRKSIEKVAQNPLPKSEGGYGKPLGGELAGCNKIKLLGAGLRVVYKLVKVDGIMRIIVISARADDEVYIEAAKRIKKYEL